MPLILHHLYLPFLSDDVADVTSQGISPPSGTTTTIVHNFFPVEHVCKHDANGSLTSVSLLLLFKGTPSDNFYHKVVSLRISYIYSNILTPKYVLINHNYGQNMGHPKRRERINKVA